MYVTISRVLLPWTMFEASVNHTFAKLLEEVQQQAMCFYKVSSGNFNEEKPIVFVLCFHLRKSVIFNEGGG